MCESSGRRSGPGLSGLRPQKRSRAYVQEVIADEVVRELEAFLEPINAEALAAGFLELAGSPRIVEPSLGLPTAKMAPCS